MPAAKSLVGQTFSRLTVLERYGSRKGRVNWLCRCECGKLHEAVSHALTSGHTKSCGCWKDERNTSTEPTHGHASRKTGLSPTYQSWRGMWTRCTNPNVKSYRDYGGRGVQICERWKDFGNFLADITDQLAAAQEEWNQCSGLLDDAHRSIEMLEDQLAKAEQRVAEACADFYQDNLNNGVPFIAKRMRNGEWRKFVKEV